MNRDEVLRLMNALSAMLHQAGISKTLTIYTDEHTVNLTPPKCGPGYWTWQIRPPLPSDTAPAE
jgi:hypothetical protein